MAASRFLAREDGNLQQSSLVTSRSQVFRDLDVTFAAKPSKEISVKKDAAAVKQAVKNLILTNHFEKPFQPFFGGNLSGLIFELADDTTGLDVEEQIVSAIQQYEPRAQLIDIDVNSQPDRNSIAVTITFKVVNTQEIVTFTTNLSRLR